MKSSDLDGKHEIETKVLNTGPNQDIHRTLHRQFDEGLFVGLVFVVLHLGAWHGHVSRRPRLDRDDGHEHAASLAGLETLNLPCLT